MEVPGQIDVKQTANAKEKRATCERRVSAIDTVELVFSKERTLNAKRIISLLLDKW